MPLTFPNESPEYRAARKKLLASETALRRQMETVASELRALPPGGEVPEDYVLERAGARGEPESVRLSELFRGGDTLMAYHFMFPRHPADTRPAPAGGAMSEVPLEQGPCASCTALLDMWDRTMPHFEGLGGNLVIVAKAPIDRVTAFVHDHGWKHLRFVSASNSSFRGDYHGDDREGHPVPIMTVFKRDAEGRIRLHWASELVDEPVDAGQDMRHLGTVEPLWTLFDLTPNGRPKADEQFHYPCCKH